MKKPAHTYNFYVTWADGTATLVHTGKYRKPATTQALQRTMGIALDTANLGRALTFNYVRRDLDTNTYSNLG